jgi:hypothetical protein
MTKHELIDHELETTIDKDNLVEYTLTLKVAVDDEFARKYVAQMKSANAHITLGMMFDLLGKK